MGVARVDTTIVTTFSPRIWKDYGEGCVQSWAEHFPPSVHVSIYLEELAQTDAVAQVIPSFWRCATLTDDAAYRTFMATHRRQGLAAYRKDARRFAHKVFAMGLAARAAKTRFLVWLDADVFCFADIPDGFFPALFAEHDLFYLGRSAYTHSECGCWGLDTTAPHHPTFSDAFVALYASGQVFQLAEQHDSWVFDWLRTRQQRTHGLTCRNLTPHVGKGHVWLASPLACYADHWKGDRWKTRRSWREDEAGLTAQGVQLQLTHPYWRHLPSRRDSLSG